MKHVMVDLETLGTGYDGAVVTIGATSFNPFELNVLSEKTFYIAIDIAEALRYGRMTADTMKWWMMQSLEARQAVIAGKVPAEKAAREFNRYLLAVEDVIGGTGRDVAVWGNGATFDNVLLRSMFSAVGVTPTWSFRNDKCYRTVINLLPPERQPALQRQGVHHNALDDAIYQAQILQRVYRELGIKEEGR